MSVGCGQGAQEKPGVWVSGPQCGHPLSPCSQVDRLVALARLRQSGAFLSTSEGLILQLVGDAAHPQFKEVLVPDPSPSVHLTDVFSVPTASLQKTLFWEHTHIREHRRLLPPPEGAKFSWGDTPFVNSKSVRGEAAGRQ